MVVSAALSPGGNLGKDHQGFFALDPGQVLLHQGRALQALLLRVKSLGDDTVRFIAAPPVMNEWGTGRVSTLVGE